MKTSDFEIRVPPEMIAQEPVTPRDFSKLLVADRSGKMGDGRRLINGNHFYDLPDFLRSGDTLIFNNSRVIPARLKGNIESRPMEAVTILLLNKEAEKPANTWEALVEEGEVKEGDWVDFQNNVRGHIKATYEKIGRRKERLVSILIEGNLEDAGELPIPPYVHGYKGDPEKYQTIYSKIQGSAAAPTAGLHFTPELLHELSKKGVNLGFVTLHVGVDTFMPVYEEDPIDHKMYTEWCEMSVETAELINTTKEEGRRVICVGTTSARTVETAGKTERVRPIKGPTDIYIYEGYQWKVVDALITNFHYPRSTNLIMISSFLGEGPDFTRQVYEKAVQWNYRFYSFGDAMLII